MLSSEDSWGASSAPTMSEAAGAGAFATAPAPEETLEIRPAFLLPVFSFPPPGDVDSFRSPAFAPGFGNFLYAFSFSSLFRRFSLSYSSSWIAPVARLAASSVFFSPSAAWPACAEA